MKRKSLMHIDQKNAIQFVTFRTQESVAYYLAKNNINTAESIAKQQLRQDRFLDSSSAGAILNDQVIKLLITFFKSKHTIHYNLIAVSIMPNHIHLLFEQIQPLMETMKKLKGATAQLVNKHYKRTGTLWDRGYFDKVVRTEKQFQVTYQYIKKQCSKRGIKRCRKEILRSL